MRGRDLKGFTLVEMLIVLGIVAILSALILTSLGRMKGRALQTTCANNLGQMGKAIVMYCADYDGGIPPLTNRFNGPKFYVDGTPLVFNPLDRPDYLWEIVGPYVKTREVLFCPRDPDVHLDSRRWSIDHRLTSYTMQGPNLDSISSGWYQDDFSLPRLKRGGGDVAFAADAEMFNGNFDARPESDHLGVFQIVTYDGSLHKAYARDREREAP